VMFLSPLRNTGVIVRETVESTSAVPFIR
jgi:hypothetical protein